MKNLIFIPVIMSSFALYGCFETQNPLNEIAPKIIAKEVFEIGADKNDCMHNWKNPDAVSTQGFVYKMCEDIASNIAIHLTKNGYGKVNSQNVKSLNSWAEIETEIKNLRSVRRKETKEKTKNMFKNWGRNN